MRVASAPVHRQEGLLPPFSGRSLAASEAARQLTGEATMAAIRRRAKEIADSLGPLNLQQSLLVNFVFARMAEALKR